MKTVVTVLTALLTFLLSASLPGPVETCCRPQTHRCCAKSTCGCHMSAPSKPAPTAAMPATIHAPTEALAPASGGQLRPLTPSIPVATVALAGAHAGGVRLYSLTHAFLI